MLYRMVIAPDGKGAMSEDLVFVSYGNVVVRKGEEMMSYY
jgi:hypothetical protein